MTHQKPSNTTPATKQPRITAINLVRLFVISLVIATHIGASGPLYNSFFSGSIWMISHVSRLLFVTLTALVLMYNYGPSRPFHIKSFYLKRFTLVLLPYLAWTLIYQLQDGFTQANLLDFIGTYWHNLITAGAMYHLYFLLVTMQLYLLFPLIRYLYGKLQKRPIRTFAISLGIQLALTALLHYTSAPKGLEWYWNVPDNYIWTYQFYLVCGALVATHVTKFAHVSRRHTKAIVGTGLLTTAIIEALYILQYNAGIPANVATAVYQPLIVLTSVVYGTLFLTLGFRWVEKGEKFGAWMSSVAENSFGIYLVHVFIIVKLSVYQPNQNDFLTGLVILVIELPLVYFTAFLFTEIARRTPLSVVLTGRKRVPLRKIKPRIEPVAKM